MLGSFKFTNASKGSLHSRNMTEGLAREEMPFVFESCSMVVFVRKHGNLSSAHRYPDQPH